MILYEVREFHHAHDVKGQRIAMCGIEEHAEMIANQIRRQNGTDAAAQVNKIKRQKL